MELITAAYCWQIINKLPRMNRATCCETQCREAVYTLITYLHSKRYRLIHRQNSYAPCGRRRSGRCELVKWVKILPVHSKVKVCLWKDRIWSDQLASPYFITWIHKSTDALTDSRPSANFSFMTREVFDVHSACHRCSELLFCKVFSYHITTTNRL
jgi:hypothetical protein